MKLLTKITRKKPVAITYNRSDALLYMGVPYIFGVETPKKPTFIPEVLWLITDYGVIEDHRFNIRAEVSRRIEYEIGPGPNDFLVYKNRKPVYMGNWDGEVITPFCYPDPASIKLTSIDLYAKVKTYVKTLTRLIARNAKHGNDSNKKSLFAWMMAALFTILILVFMLVVTIASGDKDDVITSPAVIENQQNHTTQQSSQKADLTIPTPTPTPVNRAINTPVSPAKGVLIEPEE